MNPLLYLWWALGEFYHTFGHIGLILLAIGLVFGIWAIVRIARKMAK